MRGRHKCSLTSIKSPGWIFSFLQILKTVWMVIFLRPYSTFCQSRTRKGNGSPSMPSCVRLSSCRRFLRRDPISLRNARYSLWSFLWLNIQLDSIFSLLPPRDYDHVLAVPVIARTMMDCCLWKDFWTKISVVETLCIGEIYEIKKSLIEINGGNGCVAFISKLQKSYQNSIWSGSLPWFFVWLRQRHLFDLRR